MFRNKSAQFLDIVARLLGRRKSEPRVEGAADAPRTLAGSLRILQPPTTLREMAYPVTHCMGLNR